MKPLSTAFSAICLAALLMTTSNSQEVLDSPVRIIEKAIKASGGKDRLAKLLKYRVKTKGKFFNANGANVDIVAEAWREHPSLGRLVAHIDDGKDRETFVRIVNKESVWENVNGELEALDDNAIREIQHAQYLDYLSLLFPLLEEKRFSLATISDPKAIGRDLIGVKVVCKAKVDVSLFFDKKTDLLMKVTWPAIDPRRKGRIDDIHFDSYKKLHGIMFAHRVSMYLDGRKDTQSDLIELEPLKTIDPKMFTKPGK